MGIQEVKRGGAVPEYPNTRKPEQAEGFYERLRQNMKYRGGRKRILQVRKRRRRK